MKPNSTSRLLRNIKRLRMLFFGGFSLHGAREEMRAMRVSYSQFGEDLVVDSHFRKAAGLFIDVGAYHPFKLSNTKLLSSLGWRGVNIDCDPEKITRFETLRPDDCNVCAAVSDAAEELVWLHYPEGTTDRLATRDESDLRSALGEQPLSKIPVKTMTLTAILDASPFRGKHFHYLNIDCEGHDLAVLQGLDFQRYAPDLITIEALSETSHANLTRFLEPLGYRLTDIVRLTLFFKRGPAERFAGTTPS